MRTKTRLVTFVAILASLGLLASLARLAQASSLNALHRAARCASALLPAVDCNSNGTDDALELPAHDCNTNSTLDACDIAVVGTGTAVNSIAVLIPDVSTTASTITAAQQVFVSDVNVQVSVRHTATGNLTLALARLGTTVTLASGLGGAGDNFSNTLFDQQAAIPITAAAPPFAGAFVPQFSLDAFNGIQKSGVWTLLAEFGSCRAVGWAV